MANNITTRLSPNVGDGIPLPQKKVERKASGASIEATIKKFLEEKECGKAAQLAIENRAVLQSHVFETIATESLDNRRFQSLLCVLSGITDPVKRKAFLEKTPHSQINKTVHCWLEQNFVAQAFALATEMPPGQRRDKNLKKICDHCVENNDLVTAEKAASKITPGETQKSIIDRLLAIAKKRMAKFGIRKSEMVPRETASSPLTLPPIKQSSTIPFATAYRFSIEMLETGLKNIVEGNFGLALQTQPPQANQTRYLLHLILGTWLERRLKEQHYPYPEIFDPKRCEELLLAKESRMLKLFLAQLNELYQESNSLTLTTILKSHLEVIPLSGHDKEIAEMMEGVINLADIDGTTLLSIYDEVCKKLRNRPDANLVAGQKDNPPSPHKGLSSPLRRVRTSVLKAGEYLASAKQLMNDLKEPHEYKLAFNYVVNLHSTLHSDNK